MPSSPTMKKPGLDFSALETPNPFQDQCLPSPGHEDTDEEKTQIPASEKGPVLERSPSPRLRQSSSVEFDGAGPRYERLYRMSMEIAAKKENLRRSVTDFGFEPKGMADNLRGSRPSSAFVSKTKSREIFQARDGPSPGNYEIPGFGAEIAKKSTRVSSVFSSTTSRLPSPKTDGPDVGAYDFANVYTIGSGVKGGKILSTSERFAEDLSIAPGPGAYELADNKSPTAHSPSSVFASKTKARDLPVYTIETPSPGSYDVDSFIECEKKKKKGVTAFASKSPRVQEVAKIDTPPVGAYDVFDPRKSTTFAASIFSGAERFPTQKAAAPGPGEYEVPDIKKKQVYGPSSAFCSKTKARDLPVGVVDTPGPLSYNIEGMAEKVEKKRPSSAFTSRSPRMVETRHEGPPVGAYDAPVVPLKKSGGINMSAKTTERFPDPRKSTNGPLSEYKPLDEERVGIRKIRSVTTAAS